LPGEYPYLRQTLYLVLLVFPVGWRSHGALYYLPFLHLISPGWSKIKKHGSYGGNKILPSTGTRSTSPLLNWAGLKQLAVHRQRLRQYFFFADIQSSL